MMTQEALNQISGLLSEGRVVEGWELAPLDTGHRLSDFKHGGAWRREAPEAEWVEAPYQDG